jgi:outer membrane protein OmpA-like peptidoglycan-associated protein
MQSVAVLERHLLVRRESPVWPFAWRGLLPLLALAALVLLALGPFARGTIEASIAREIRDELNAAGFDWVAVRVSGQNVTLSGDAPASGAGARAIALAQGATCATWIGRRTCAVSVVARFTTPAAAPEAAAAPAAAGSAGPVGAPDSAGSTTQACDRALAAVLAGQQISFASGSAAIEAASAPLLDALARELSSCPGVIRIEGHTDTIGRGKFNRALSAARAAAVRDALIVRGIPAERLRARGYGARRPIADNTTEEGRARNRRIELHPIPPGKTLT